MQKFQRTLKQYPSGTEIDVFKQNPNESVWSASPLDNPRFAHVRDRAFVRYCSPFASALFLSALVDVLRMLL